MVFQFFGLCLNTASKRFQDSETLLVFKNLDSFLRVDQVLGYSVVPVVDARRSTGSKVEQ